LFNAAAEVEYCNAHYDETNALLDELMLNARCFDDILQSHITKVLMLGAQGKYQEAFDTGFHFLEVLGGDPFPVRPSKLRILRDVLKTKWMLRGKSTDDILNLPIIESPGRLASLQMLSLLSFYTYTLRQDLWILVSDRIIQYTLLYGLSEMGCASFGFFGMMLWVRLGLLDEGYMYCQVALRMFERFNTRSYIARVYAPVYVSLYFWKGPVRNCLEPLRTAHRVGLETGDIEVRWDQ
jgi:predicted ATPase